MKNDLNKQPMKSYLKFISIYFLIQIGASSISLESVRKILGNNLTELIDSILLWVAPGRMLLKHPDNTFFNTKNILSFIGINFIGLLCIASPIYFLFLKMRAYRLRYQEGNK